MPLHVSCTMCPSTGGQNCIIQHMVSSHSVGGLIMHRLREECKFLEKNFGLRASFKKNGPDNTTSHQDTN